MRKLSRTSLAAAICPSAPFLAPRLLRATVPTAVRNLQSAPSPCLQTSCYATTTAPKGKKPQHKFPTRPEKQLRARAAHEDVSSLLGQLNKACDVHNTKLITDLYARLLTLNARALDRDVTRRVAQSLHFRARQKGKDPDKHIISFILQMVAHIRSGVLAPHPLVFVHVLGIYKEYGLFDSGRELWQWLVQRDDTMVSQGAYGAAIELLAYDCERPTPLPELEALYVDGLKRFPGTFAEYHLAPDAIVPDRSQPILAAGVPVMLFQGILTARILARDWKRAYLGLDTILRLYPNQTPTRFFELFMTERPLSEAYTAFLMACRAGTALSAGRVTTLLAKLRLAMSTTESMVDRVKLLRAVANALYAHQEAGGQLVGLHISVFLRCFEHVLPELPAGEDFQGEAIQLRNILVLTAHEIAGGLLTSGLNPPNQPLEALVSLAGKLRVPDLLRTALQDLENTGIELAPIPARSALTSAGLLKNQDLIKKLWTRIVTVAASEGSQIPFEDWMTFTKACKRAGLQDYFREQLSSLSHTTTAAIQEHLAYILAAPELATEKSNVEYMSADELSAEMDGLKHQMKNVEAILMSGAPLDLKQSPFYMHIDPSTTLMSSLENLRIVYDELTTDPHQPAPRTTEGAPITPALSPTKIPLDELRFMNWMTVHDLMAEAELNEAQRNQAVTQAIRVGKPWKERPAEFRRHFKPEPIQSVEELRERIRALRNPTHISAPVVRKVGSQAR